MWGCFCDYLCVFLVCTFIFAYIPKSYAGSVLAMCLVRLPITQDHILCQVILFVRKGACNIFHDIGMEEGGEERGRVGRGEGRWKRERGREGDRWTSRKKPRGRSLTGVILGETDLAESRGVHRRNPGPRGERGLGQRV